MPVRIAIPLFILGILTASLFTRTKLLLFSSSVFSLLIILYKLLDAFPQNSNHLYVECIICISIILFFTSNINQERFAIFEKFILRLLTFILIGSGLQKVMADTYFDGSFLATQIYSNEFFSNFFSIIDSGEVARIKAQTLNDPFFLNGKLLFLSITTPIIEILAGILILSKKMRLFGLLLAVAIIFAIELAAREFLFGLLFLSLAIFFLPKDWYRKLIPLIIFAYLSLLIAKLFFPQIYFN